MDCRKKVKRWVAAIVCMALIIWSGLVYAQGSEDGDTTAQAEDQVYAHVKSTSFSSGPFEVSVNVNTEICQEWPVQCSGTGHSSYKASSDNHNPIRIDIQVLSKTGVPVNNLKSESFSFSCPFLPIGGPSLKRLECPECFLSGGDGIYAIFVHPDPALGLRFWRDGTYILQVQVKSGSKVVRVFAPFGLKL